MLTRPPSTNTLGSDPKRGKIYGTPDFHEEDDEEPDQQDRKLVVGKGRDSGDRGGAASQSWWMNT